MATAAEDILASIDAAILSWANNGCMATLAIGGQSVTFSDLQKLKDLRAYYQEQVDQSATIEGSQIPVKFFGLRYGVPG